MGSAATLSVIPMDRWLISKYNSMSMTHQTVSHTVDFIDPTQQNTHTNNRERGLKSKQLRENVLNTSKCLFHTCLPEF